MYIPPNLILSHAIGDANHPFTLQITEAMFCHMVRAACEYLNNKYNLHGCDYEEPKQYRGFKDGAMYLTNFRYIENHGLRKDCFDTDSAHTAHAEIFFKYIEYKNKFPEKHLVGSDGLDIMTYLVAHHMHEHRVKVIEITHRESGKRFGGATGYQTFDLFAQVKDWPTRYKFDEYIKELDHTPLPKDRPGYFDDVDKIPKNMTEIDINSIGSEEN